MCSDVRCWVGPQAPTEAKAIEYWNRVAWFCPTISPVAQKPRTTPIANAPQGVALTGDGAGARREALLRARYPQLEIRSLRGNLDTRLRKLDEGQYDAIILAGAGLIRLGLKDRIRSLLTPEQSLPAPGQGALGIELVAGAAAMAAVVAPLNDAVSAHCVRAERAFSRALGGSCQVPLGAYAIVEDDGRLWLRGFVATPDGKDMVAGELHGDPAADEALGQKLADQLRARGAGAILEKLAACS